ncbi:MAG: TetR/AcrR family transcriptional regulator [Eubacteriales bacterium]|nr:TetR/AcrR family transcriptional regulator [Eubacteriales bacterium]MDY3332640.1 TetR/AcrR family transcriptional regulator [Gallibacter sp.]
MCATKRLSEAERKKEIMDSAAKVIIEKGFEKATMEDIIAGTTLSKGGVYHYYGSVVQIFKDIMISGIEYRNEIIKEHLAELNNEFEKQFFAEQLFNKIIDDNPYMPLYVEFLISKKRNPELNKLMVELQVQTQKSFQSLTNTFPKWLSDINIFQFITHFINAMIIASDVLDARESFKKHKKLIEEMFILVLEQGNLKL